MKKISISIRLKITRITILLTVAAAAQGGWIKVPSLKVRSGKALEMEIKP